MSVIPTFNIGSRVRVYAECRTITSYDPVTHLPVRALTTPASLTATFELPDSTTVTPTPVVDQTGVEYAELVTTLAGEHHITMRCPSGVGQGAGQATFQVRAAL